MALPSTLRSRRSSDSTRVPVKTFTKPRRVLPAARRPLPKRRLPIRQKRVPISGLVNEARLAGKLFRKKLGEGITYWAGSKSPKRPDKRRPPIRR